MCNGQRLSSDSVPCLGLLPKDAQQPGRRRRSRLGSRSGRNQRGYLSSSPDSRVLSSAARSARGSHVQLRVGVRCRCVACRFINHGPLRTCRAAAQRVATRRRSSGCCRPTGLAVAAGAWWSARPDRTHPSTHVSKPGRNPFLENWRTGAREARRQRQIGCRGQIAGIPSRMNAHCMLPEFGQAVGRVEPGSKAAESERAKERTSVGDCTPPPAWLAWVGDPTGHSRRATADLVERDRSGGSLLDRSPIPSPSTPSRPDPAARY